MAIPMNRQPECQVFTFAVLSPFRCPTHGYERIAVSLPECRCKPQKAFSAFTRLEMRGECGSGCATKIPDLAFDADILLREASEMRG